MRRRRIRSALRTKGRFERNARRTAAGRTSGIFTYTRQHKRGIHRR